MPQFRLGVTPDHLEVATEGQPAGLLLGIAEGEDVGHEHDPVEGGGEGVVGEGGDEGLEFFGGRDFSFQGRWAWVGADAGGAAEFDESDELGEGAGMSLGSVEVVVVVVGEDAGSVADDEGFEAAAPGGEGGGSAIEEVCDAEGGEGGGGAFGGQVGVDGLGWAGGWMAGVGVRRGGGAHGGSIWMDWKVHSVDTTANLSRVSRYSMIFTSLLEICDSYCVRFFPKSDFYRDYKIFWDDCIP